MKHTLEIRRPDDWHVHLRDGDMLRAVLPSTSNVFGRALVMPNIDPPVVDAHSAMSYRGRIEKALDEVGTCGFQPEMAIKLTPQTTPSMIENARKAGVIAAKLYPDRWPGRTGGEVTTNAGGGIYDFDCQGPLGAIFVAMQSVGMVLCVHAETPDVFVMDRERDFVDGYISEWSACHPDLKIVIEHATTRCAIDMAKKRPNVACSITAHHLVLTLDDVIGGRISPHSFCKPVAKTPADRAALVKAATSGDPSFFFGSDSAPHLRHTKETDSGAAGCYTTPIAMPLLAEAFEDVGALDKLEAFTSENGANHYGQPLSVETITLERREWRPLGPDFSAKIRVFGIDRTFRWKVVE